MSKSRILLPDLSLPTNKGASGFVMKPRSSFFTSLTDEKNSGRDFEDLAFFGVIVIRFFSRARV